MHTFFRMLAALALCGSAAATEIHKCRGADGQVSWSDKPCPGDATTESTRAAAGPTVQGLAPHCSRTDLEWQDGEALRRLDPATLPDTQREAFVGVLYGLAYGGTREIRWRIARGGDLHFCLGAAGAGAPREIVVGSDGKVVRFSGAGGKYLNDPDAPAARQSACSSATTACYSPGAGRGLDQCVADVPTCGSLSGRECCPQECKDAYRRERAAGTDPMGALQRVLFGDSSCIPGMNEARAGVRVAD